MRLDIDYLGSLRCEITHQLSGMKLITDAPKDNGGEGAYFSPTDLLAASLGSCMMTLMGLYAKKHGIDLQGTTMQVEKTMSQSPRKVAKLEVTINFFHKIASEHQEGLKKAALECPVHKSLDPDIVIETHFNWAGM